MPRFRSVTRFRSRFRYRNYSRFKFRSRSRSLSSFGFKVFFTDFPYFERLSAEKWIYILFDLLRSSMGKITQWDWCWRAAWTNQSLNVTRGAPATPPGVTTGLCSSDPTLTSRLFKPSPRGSESFAKLNYGVENMFASMQEKLSVCLHFHLGF